MQRIAESELIINARGAIYHLDLKPEELANNIITVGDPDRVGEVSKYFDTIDVKASTQRICDVIPVILVINGLQLYLQALVPIILILC